MAIGTTETRRPSCPGRLSFFADHYTLKRHRNYRDTLDMANKLPWMKHDHNARKDLFLRRAHEQFGHFGYSGYFKLLEVLHEQGTGDNLCITMAQLAKELDSRSPQVRLYLDFCRTSGKLSWSEVGQELNIVIKNFRKKQDKKNLKTDEPTGQTGTKGALDVDVEEEGDKDKKGFLEKLKRMAGGFRVKPWTATELEGHQFPFGKEKGRRVIDMEPGNCQMYLNQIEMDAKTTAALKHRIKLKAAEAIR